MLERIDVDALLAPLDPVSVGGDVREGGSGSDLFLRLKDARAAARVAEREASNAESDSDPLRAGLLPWSELADGAAELLAGHTKDLDVGAWLTEAMLRTGGLEGLADGFELLGGLIERFWGEGLWPAADEDGDETRLGALFGLFGRGSTGTLLQPLKLVALSDRGATFVTLSSAELAAAPAPPRVADEEAQAVVDDRRAAALDAVTAGIARSSRPFLVALRAALIRARDALEALMQTIDRVSTVGRFGSQVGEPLATALRLLEDHAGFAFAAETDETTEAMVEADGSPSHGSTGGRRAPSSREEALTTVLSIADFFDKSEPQAPIGLSLREVVRRARLPLEALLSELLPDAASRTLFLQRAGIRSAVSDVNDFE